MFTKKLAVYQTVNLVQHSFHYGVQVISSFTVKVNLVYLCGNRYDFDRESALLMQSK